MKTAKGKPKNGMANPYEGVELIDRFREKVERSPKFQMKKKPDGSVSMWLEDDEAMQMAIFMDSIGTDDLEFVSDFLGHMLNGTNENRDTPDHNRFAFTQAVVQGIEPKDQIEAMLACQMAAVHVCTTQASRRYLLAEHAETRNNAERSLNRLTRTFTAQMETLKKYRNGGKQTVRVERVTVNEGGQAIVGTVETGGGSQEK